MSYWAQLGLQNGANTILESIIYFHDYMMIFLLIISIFVIYFLILIIINVKLDKEFLDSHRLETIWTVIPIIILGFIAYPSLTILYFIEATESTQIDYSVKVIAHQWYWEYEMGQNSLDSALKFNPQIFYTLEATTRLQLPLMRTITLYIRRADVLHRFTIPALGIKIDAIPGRRNTLRFRSNLPGKYFGQCSEICGANHRFIPIQCLIK